MKKRDKILLFYLIRDRVNDILDSVEESEEPGVIQSYLEIVRYVQLAETLHLDINELIDPEEYLSIKKYLLLKGYVIDD